MGKRTAYEPGTFSFVELASPDPDASKAFYGRLFGWKADDTEIPGQGTYTTFLLDGDPVSACYQQDEEQRAAGAPPNWTNHVTVADADVTAGRAAELGGTVLVKPMDAMGLGRYAILTDPAGAAFALWQPIKDIGATRVNDPGCMSWNDLVTPDPQGAIAFYTALFDWQIDEIPEAHGYCVIRNAGRSNGGIMPASLMGGEVPPHWLPYFNAGVMDERLAVAEEAGANVIVPPRPVPAGRFALLQDPQGAYTALFEGKTDD